MVIQTVSDALPSVLANVKDTISQLFDFITAQGDTDYIGEAVSQLEHSLQTAQLAQDAGADRDTILGALLHDIGRFIPMASKMPTMIAPDGKYVGRASHEVLGERYLRQLGFNEKICQLVGAHVMAKRYLTAVDKDYYARLSRSSKATLEFQGGIFDKIQVAEAQKDPLLQEKLAVRRWDDQGKVPNMKTKPLSYYKSMAIKSLTDSRSLVTLHDRTYEVPRKPTVVVCVDGFDPEYLAKGVEDGILPNLAAFMENGFHATAKSAMPSFTNPNNVSIITGVPPAKHGITGNFFLDPQTGDEHMIADDTFLRGSTILEQMARNGVRVVAITAKDKLRRILGHGLQRSICFSAELATDCTLQDNGICDVEKWLGCATPPQYSGELSLFVLDARIKLLREGRADLYYLTLSDYIQHKYEPGSKESDSFFAALDQRIGELTGLGAVVAVTGDHGMSDKCGSDGFPNILFLQDQLEKKFGKDSVRVICPITDPFVRHYGALGSFARIHFRRELDVQTVLSFCDTFPEIEVCYSGRDAGAVFELPLDREGDVVIVAKGDCVIGSSADEHDLSNLGGHRLRSHGGLSEQEIPILLSVPVRDGPGFVSRSWRNYDVFDLALNCAEI